MKAPAKPRGKPASDVSLLCRNRLWVWMIYNSSPGLSWDGLDKYWLPMIDDDTPTAAVTTEKRDRRRVFHRIFKQATDPASTKGLNGKTLVEVVRASGEHPVAAAMYDSPLWRLVGSRPLALGQIESLRNRLIDEFGLFEATDDELSVAGQLEISHWGLTRGNLEHVRIAAARVARQGTADAIALLGCCFQRALDHLCLREADIYLRAVGRAYRKIYNTWCMQPEVSSSLQTLIDIRLIRRLEVAIPPEDEGFRVRRRKMTSASSPETPFGATRLANRIGLMPPTFPPIVAVDPILRDFINYYPQLYADAMQTITDYAIASHDYSLPEEDLAELRRKFADDALDGVQPRRRKRW